MKKTLLIISFLAASFSSVTAATLIASNGDSGFTLADGATALSSGRVRFGIFVVSDSLVISNKSDLAYLNANFREVASYSGAFNGFDLPGFFEQNLTYAGGSTLYPSVVGTQYDLSSASLSNVANDIAGSKIYMWALDNAVVANATQQAIFFDNANVWTDSDTVGVTDSYFSTENVTALIGSLGTGANIGAGGPSHSLAAIPEPSRAILGLAGLGALFFRRRRA